MSSSDINDLHKIWLKFLNTTKTEDGENWLDIFLIKYLSLLCGPNVNINNSFSFQWKSSGNILAHQLLSDMYQICETVKANSLNDTDNANVSQPFKRYLLEGRGWKILWTLENIGIQNLLCLKDLIKLLVLHVPVLLSLPVCISSVPACLQRKPKCLPLSSCFILSKRIKHVPYNIDLRWPDNCVPKKKRTLFGKKRIRRKRLKVLDKDSSSSSGDDQVLFEPCAIPASQLRTLQKVHRINSASVPKSLSEVDESDQEPPLMDLSLPIQLQDFKCYTISVMDYMHFILNLFQESAQLDHRNSEYTSCSAPLILEFSLNTLKDIHNGRYSFQGWLKEDVHSIRDQLLKLVFLAATVTYSGLNYTGAPNENEVISTLLNISDEIICLQSRSTSTVFISDVIKGCLMLINNTIGICSEDYAKIICVVRTFYANGASICYYVISSLDKECEKKSENNDVFTIISLIKGIIIFLKYEKVSALYSGNSSANISVKDSIHHHNDLFGPSASYIDSSKEPVCCIGSMSCILLKIFNLPVSKYTSNEVIKQLKMCGICCCLNPGFVLNILFSRFNNFDFETQHLTLLLLEKSLFPQLGLIGMQNQCSCCSARLNQSENKTLPILEKYNVSHSHHVKEINLNMGTTFWNSFNVYGDLLNSCAIETLENITKHLIQIFADGADEFKRQLFIKVILPQFLHLSTSEHFSSPSQKIKSKCFLYILQLVLSENSLSVIFVNFGGIPNLYPFLQISEFRSLSLRALKILISSENEVNEEIDFTNSYSTMMHLPASVTFCDFLLEHTQLFSENLGVLLSGAEQFETDRMSNVNSLTASVNNCVDSEGRIYFICDLWKCYKEVLSSIKKDYFYRMSEKAFDSGYNLFITLLKNLNRILSLQDFSKKPDVAKNLLLLIQSLLTVCIKTQKEISTKIAVLETVKNNLKVQSPKSPEYQILLFEFILKCCFYSAPVISSIQYQCKGRTTSSTEMIDGITSSDKEITDVGSYGESYAGDTEGSSSGIFQSSTRYEITHQTFIEHGEVVKMLFELLIHFQRDDSSNWLPSALYLVQSIIKLCQECEMNKIVLCQQGMPTMLIESFSGSLKSCEDNFYDYQKATLELYVLLAQHSIEPADLRKIISFFKSPFAPTALILKSLNILIDNIVLQPVWSVSFPCPRKLTSNTKRLKKRLKMVYNIYDQYASYNNSLCAWTCSALCFPVTEDTRWNSFSKGFSFTLWMKLDSLDHLCPFLMTESNRNFILYKRQISGGDDNKDLFENCAHMFHIISTGSNKFLLELWYDIYEKDLIVRIISCNNGEVTCLSKGIFKSVLQINIWHHLALNYSEDVNKSTINSRVQIVLDGSKENVLNLTFKRSGANILNNCYILLGHSESNLEDTITPAYSIGNFMFFKGDILSRDIIYYLSCLGPNMTNITDCALQKRNSFIPKQNLYQSVASLISLDVFVGIKTPSLVPLQNSLLCSYIAEKEDSYLVYPSLSRGFFPLRYTLSGNSKISSSQDALPLELQVLSTGYVSCAEHHDFQYALQRAGGITIFLFLFAYILEHENNRRDLPDVLNLILKLINKNTIIAEDFIQIKGYELLTQMIISKKCIITHELFQILLQNCATCFSQNKEIRNANIQKFGKPSIISNAAIFSLMLKSIAFARNTTVDVQFSLFSCLDSLLTPKLANVIINVEQITYVHTLKSLLWLLKENYIMSEECFPESIALMIPHIMQKLLLFKFDGSVFKSICLFTLLLHKSSTTYVCHSRPAFFFLTIIDKLCNRKDGLNNQTSTTIWYADEVANYFPLQKEIDSSILKRSVSAPDENSVSNHSVKENRTLLKMKSADCLDFSSDTKNMQQFSNNLEHRTDFDSEINISKDKREVSNTTEVSKISIGLLKLINSFINRDSPVDVLHLIQPEICIVLSYTNDSEVCVSALKVLSSFLKEASENFRNSFLNIKGFHLLSNQLHQHLYDRRIFDACFSFLFDIPLLSVDLSNLYNSGEVTTFHVMSWLPLLAIIPNASSDTLICEKIVSILTKFLRLGPTIVVDLLDNGLSMSISLLIIQISQDYKVEVSNLKRKELDKCLKAIGDLMKVISIELCSSKRSKDFSELCEVLHLFSDLESKSLEEYGPDCHTVCVLRDYQCIMFQVIKDLSQFWDFRTLKSDSSFLNDKTVWELLTEFQESLGTFSTISVPVDDIATEPEVHYPAETSHIAVERSILEIPMTEIINRFEYMLEEATNFIIFKDPRIKISLKERDFIKTIFIFCIKGLGISMSKNVNIMKSEYSTLMCCLKDVLKKELSILLMAILSPNQDIKMREYVVEILATHPLKQKILQLVVFSISRIENFLIFLDDLLSNSPHRLKRSALVLCDIIKDLLHDSLPLRNLENTENIEKLKTGWIQLWNEDRYKWMGEISKANKKMLFKFEILAQEVSNEALKVTQKVFELQNEERKSFMEELKTKYYQEASERMTWFKLVEQMTHEKAIWHLSDAYPRSWELDPTEGPLRIRRRLKRCYLKVDPRFLKSDYTDRLVANKDETPFVNLLLHQNEFPDSAAVLHRLHSHEQIEFTSTCKIVTAFEEATVEILIGASCIHLIGETTLSHMNKLPVSESWPFDSIKEIVPRRYELQNNAFEIFLTNGLTYLIAFDSEREFQYIWKQLEKHDLPCQPGIDVSYLTQLWRENAISNFEYLTQLNKLAGRSFNDLMQYPVFPFILADYTNSYLNLLDPVVYRNLEKPVAVQHKYREKFYKDTFDLLKEQACGPFSQFELPISGAYHYGSHYSNSGTVLHFLIRLLPYTYSFIKYQDNNFDIPDRAFHSVDTSWQLVTKDSTSDVKELIPEFFFLPEFLSNQNGFDLGVRQSGIRVNDVLLPPWCKQNPRLFILIHRQALESETVTKNLHNWIDLVFGFKQTGEAAVKAINVFHPATYYGFDINQWKDPITKQALKAMIKTLGQMPKQLFSVPHPMVSLSLDLRDENCDLLEAVDTVKGLRWGDFVGSPSTGTPSLVWCRKQISVLGNFLPLLANCMFGLGENICLLLNQKKNSDISSATYIMSAALVSWGHKDGIVRIKLCRDQPAIPLLQESNLDPVCLCASVPDCEKLFIAHSSGIISVYSLYIGSSGQTITLEQPVLQLNAHTDLVTSIYICKSFSIFVSSSKDGSVVIWDLNRLCYVRSLIGDEGSVHLVTVSDTLGDIAFTSSIGDESCLRVHTINGEVVGKVKVLDIITALCYSTAPEGISVNLIATGLRSGIIRLWSSWDLKPVREITCDRFLLPIKCIVFSADNQHLFASNENGIVAVWEKPSKGLTNVPRLSVFT